MSSEITEVTMKCRVCGRDFFDHDGPLPGVFERVFDLGLQHLTGFPDKSLDKPPQAPLYLIQCSTCGLVQLDEAVDQNLIYKDYGYRSGTNPQMREDLRELFMAGLQAVGGLTPDERVIDIGANDGTFLRQAKQMVPGCVTIGFDPCNIFKDKASQQGIDYCIEDYFGGKHFSSTTKAKLIFATAMFYDLKDPVQFLKECKEVLAPDGLIVIQMNYLKDMLEKTGFDNISHEHLTYFSLKTFWAACDKADLRVADVSFNAVNGGSMRVFVSKPHRAGIDGGLARMAEAIAAENKAKLEDLKTWKAFSRRCRKIRNVVRTYIGMQVSMGRKIYVLGASTRGLVIMEYCGLKWPIIKGCSERSETKLGKFYSGTEIPCVSEEYANSMADIFLLLPYHLEKNIGDRQHSWLSSGKKKIFVPLPFPHELTSAPVTFSMMVRQEV